MLAPSVQKFLDLSLLMANDYLLLSGRSYKVVTKPQPHNEIVVKSIFSKYLHLINFVDSSWN